MDKASLIEAVNGHIDDKAITPRVLQQWWNKVSQNIDFGGGDSGTSFGNVPVGAQLPFGGSTPPEGWLLCDGSAVSRTDYADLFAVIGTSYGAGDGSTTFNLPDKRGRVSVGKNASDADFATVGKDGGEKKHKLTVNEMPSHAHSQNYNTWYNDANNYDSKISSGGSNWYHGVTGTTAYGTGNTGGNAEHNNLQPYETDNWVIKYSQIVSTLTIGTNGNWYIDGVDTGHSSKGQVGPVGPTGGPGPQGEPGPMPVFTIGTVESLEPGEQPYVRQRGTAAEPILDFGIPGADGGNAKVIIDRWEAE